MLSASTLVPVRAKKKSGQSSLFTSPTATAVICSPARATAEPHVRRNVAKRSVALIRKQLRRAVAIHDHQIEIAMVVEIGRDDRDGVTRDLSSFAARVMSVKLPLPLLRSSCSGAGANPPGNAALSGR